MSIEIVRMSLMPAVTDAPTRLSSDVRPTLVSKAARYHPEGVGGWLQHYRLCVCKVELSSNSALVITLNISHVPVVGKRLLDERY